MANYTGLRPTRAGILLIIGIIVATGLIVAGLLWVKQSGEQARRDEAVKIAEQNLEEDSKSDDVALNDGDESNQQEQAPTESNQESTPNGAEQNTSTSNNPSVTELPQTGAGDIVPFVAAGLLAFSVSSYVISRRKIVQ